MVQAACFNIIYFGNIYIVMKVARIYYDVACATCRDMHRDHKARLIPGICIKNNTRQSRWIIFVLNIAINSYT